MVGAVVDFVVVMLACALNERMQKKLDYTQAEVRVWDLHAWTQRYTITA